MRRLRTLFLSAALALLCAGAAAGQTVTSTYDKDYGLSRLDTYGFSPEEREKSDPLATNTLTEKKIKDALEEELQNCGHHPPPVGAPPSFYVSFHVRAEDKVDESGGATNYTQGTLIVDFHDAATKRLVWRGVAAGVVGRSSVDLRLAEELAKDAAKMLLEQFGRDQLGF
ncbi:MAG: DUF4136 domain-containing protein [Acidobacteria bacterium]|nr:DUF4136 domain-containing protein [Acidobacteriota bacterium]